MRKSTLFALFVLFLSKSIFAGDIESNVRLELIRLGVDGIQVYSSVVDRVYAQPADCGNDLLLETVKNKKQWRKEWAVTARIFHGTAEGYRQRRKPSLNVQRHKIPEAACGYVWELDFDRYAPSVRSPWNVWRHSFMEVLPHTVLGTKTSQNHIAKALAKRDGYGNSFRP